MKKTVALLLIALFIVASTSLSFIPEAQSAEAGGADPQVGVYEGYGKPSEWNERNVLVKTKDGSSVTKDVWASTALS